MSDVKVGQIIDATHHRDAVHFAIAPVQAVGKLYPGMDIGLIDDSIHAGACTKPIGIVDPFLKAIVMPGEWFYMFLYPLTVTGMRHEWMHPAFADNPATPIGETLVNALASEGTAVASIAWMKDFAEAVGLSYMEALQAGKDMADNPNYSFCFGDDTNSEIANEKNDDFWIHFENITGRKRPTHHTYWRCAC